MKYFTKILAINIFVLFIFIPDIFTRAAAKSACSVSTISIPMGTNTPVMVYNARAEKEYWKLTVLEKEHDNKFNVDGNLFYSDKKSGENWYVNKSIDEKSFESMRDAFSLCRTLNQDNKQTKIYEKNRIFNQFRTESLPENLALRTNKNLQSRTDNKDESDLKETKTLSNSSFLQMHMTLKYPSLHDRQLEAQLDALERNESPDLVKEQYKRLNNDAYYQRRELENQLKRDNGYVQPNRDLILD